VTKLRFICFGIHSKQIKRDTSIICIGDAQVCMGRRFESWST